MLGLRLDRILAGTAMALALAATSGADAASPNASVINDPATATAESVTTTGAVPAGAVPASTPVEAAVPEAPPPAATPDVASVPVVEPPAQAQPVVPAAPAVPQAVTETVAPDPFASLDPADRPIAEKLRDLLAA